MVLDLPNVTLLGIDCIDPMRTIRALRFSSRWVNFKEVVLVTSPFAEVTAPGVRVVKRTEGDRIDYEIDAMCLAPQITSTPYVLFMEWDSSVCNPFAWNSAWLQFDYIGAPWVRHFDKGYPPCGPHNCVGNGGFSLRSRRFYQASTELVKDHSADPALVVHDSWLCRTMRGELCRRDMQFAPIDIAYKFSCENRIYSGEFGAHGKATWEMNGWQLPNVIVS